MGLITGCSIAIFLVSIFGYALQEKTPLAEQGLIDSNQFYLNKCTYYSFFLILTITSTMRFAFVDTYYYKDVYVWCKDKAYVIDKARDMERGWYYLNYALNFISKSPKMILGLTAIVVIGAYILIIKKYSSDPLMSLLLFFFLEFMDTNNGMRQMLAAGLAIIGYMFFLKRKWWGYLIFIGLIILGMQFHESVKLVFVLMLLVIGKPLNIRIIIPIISSLIFIVYPSAFQNLFESVLDESRYEYYLDYSNGMGLMRAVIVGVVPLVFSLIYVQQNKKREVISEEEAVMINFTALNSVFVFMGLSTQFWARLAFYTAFAPMIMMPKYINTIFPEKYRRIVKPVALLLYFVFFVYNIYVNIEYGAMKDFYWSWD